MAHDVFLSHSAQNREVADAVCVALEKAGIRCWVAPRDVRPGRTFPGEITRAIQQSKVMLLIFSGHSNNSEQVLREVQLATDSRLPIIRFRIEDVALTDDLKYFLSSPHWLDALTPPLSTHIARLELAIKELLGSSVEVTGKDVAIDEAPRAEPRAATVAVPAAAAPVLPPPPPLPVAPPAPKERPAAAAKSFNPWPLIAVAAIIVVGAVVGGTFLLLRSSKPSAPQASTTPAKSAQAPASKPVTTAPPQTRVTQKSANQPARAPKPTPADTEHEPGNVSAFERAGALHRPSESKKEQKNEPKSAFDRAGNGISRDEADAPEPSPDDE